MVHVTKPQFLSELGPVDITVISELVARMMEHGKIVLLLPIFQLPHSFRDTPHQFPDGGNVDGPEVADELRFYDMSHEGSSEIQELHRA